MNRRERSPLSERIQAEIDRAANAPPPNAPPPLLPGPWVRGSLPEECPHCLRLYWSANELVVPPMPRECQRALRGLREQGRRDRATEWWHALINASMSST